MISSRHVVLLLLALLGLEVVLFSPSSSMFFCGDSLFYLSRRLESQEDVVRIFTRDDDMRSYRPLTYVLFSYVWYPLFGLDPLGSHRVALLFHLLNTVLVFLLLKELLTTEGALAGSAVFGLHSINFFITYDMTYLSDFTYLPLVLLALRAQLKSQAIRAGVFFSLTLLLKESAVVVPFLMMLCLIFKEGGAGWGRVIRKAFQRTSPYFLLLGFYVVAQLFIKSGRLYPDDPSHPFHVALGFDRLLSKYKFVLWALNLPEQFWRVRLKVWVIPWLMAPLLISGGSRLLRALDRRIALGILWFLVALSPLLLLREVPLQHHLYLPMVGLALAAGTLVRGPWPLQRQARAGALLAAFVLATALHVVRYMEFSWVSHGSRVAQDALRQVRERHPALPKGAILHILPSVEKDIVWYFDNGKLFSLFYDDPTLRVSFGDRGDRLPEGAAHDPRVFLFYFVLPHLYEVTEQLRADWADRASLQLLPRFELAEMEFDPREKDPGRKEFDTPTGHPAFLRPVARGGEVRPSLVTLPGTTLSFAIQVPTGSVLELGVTPLHFSGYGVVGQVLFQEDDSETLLHEFLLNPRDPASRLWKDLQLELSQYAGQSGTLRLRCRRNPQGKASEDRLVWSLLKIRSR
ncbi:MAG: hypothetical protein HY652_01030 [Acidobacteria bacterium]|nr:hypothetical protein [Acidobacteriota bacterium]